VVSPTVGGVISTGHHDRDRAPTVGTSRRCELVRWLNGDLIDEIPSPPTTERLDEMSIPVFAATGDNELGDYKIVAKRVCDGRLDRHQFTFRGGHMFPFENPVETSSLIVSNVERAL
jgi:hypothetical protein